MMIKVLLSSLFLSTLLLLSSSSRSSGALAKAVLSSEVNNLDSHSKNSGVKLRRSLQTGGGTIGDVAVTNGFSILATVLNATNLLAAVTDPSASLTVFAPTDDAFNALGQATLSALLADIPTLTEIVLYHVVPGAVFSSDIAASANPTLTVDTLAGQSLEINYDASTGAVTVQGGGNTSPANVGPADVAATNGVIHVIDQVLLPPAEDGDDDDDDDNDGDETPTPIATPVTAVPTTPAPVSDVPPTAAPVASSLPTIGEVAIENGFTILASLLNSTGLLETLNDPSQNLTVFAPPDAAFLALGEETLALLADNVPILTNTLLYHVLPGKTLSTDIAATGDPSLTASTVAGETQTLVISYDSATGSVTVMGEGNALPANVIQADILASNGVVHVIDQVLLPGSGDPDTAAPSMAPVNTLGDVLAEAGFSILVTLLDATDLMDAVMDPSASLTILAPNDDAFLALGQEALDALLADIPTLTNIILYHVLPGIITSTDIAAEGNPNPNPVETLAGDSQTVDIMYDATTGAVMAQGAENPTPSNVLAVDIFASNGVIHEIDQVLLPSEEDDGIPTTPAPVSSPPVVTPAPVATTPAPVATPVDTPAPVATPVDTPAPVATPVDTPAPVATPVDTPAPVTTTPAPVATTPAPVATVPTTSAPVDEGLGTIGEVAAASGQFPTLVAALELTGLLDVVNDESATLTVFAPTEEAFAAIDSSVLQFLLANPSILSQVLLYHVLPVIVTSTDIAALSTSPTSVETAAQQDVKVFNSPSIALEGVGNNGSQSAVVAADIQASNGVIHVIDQVLLPLFPMADALGVSGFTLLYAALEFTGLTGTLNAGGPYTIFAPTDSAFNAAGIRNVGDLESLGVPGVEATLLLHVLDPAVFTGLIPSSTLLHFAAMTTFNNLPILLPTLAGSDLIVTAELSSPDVVFVRGPGNTNSVPRLVLTLVDIPAVNGVVHAIDRVLLPTA